MKKPSNSYRLPVKNRGFALVVTLSLMILMTIIAVGMLTLSSISLRSTTASSAMAEARQNARMALMLALGELQKQTGPDQRITAVADIAGNATGFPLPPGATPLNNNSVNGISKGLSAVQSGTRYWTGVWRNANTTTADAEIYSKTPSPQFLKWLVSGNESATTGTFTPASNAFAVSSTGKVSDSTTAVVLAGTNSVGSPGNNLSHFVSAPLVGLKSSFGSSTRLTGRYAWWVGDEGLKSKLNMRASFTKDAKATYPFLAAQRRGWESAVEVAPYDGFKNYPLPGGDTNLSKAITLSEAALLNSSLSTPTGDSVLQRAFHSATTDSYGVLADVRLGALKLDLTACLNVGSAVPSDFANTYNPANNIIPATSGGISVAPYLIGPKWQQLKDFATFAASAASAGSLTTGTITGGAGATAPQGSGKNAAGQDLPTAGIAKGSVVIAPLIVDLRVILGGVWEVPDPAQPTVYVLRPCAKISVVLANPYPYPLKWNNLDLEIIDETPSGNGPSRIYSTGNAARPPAFVDRSSATSVLRSLFRIASGSLAPGTSRAFTVGSKTDVSTGAAVVPMVEMTAAADPQNFEICLVGGRTTLTYNTTTGGSVALDVRESRMTSTPSVELRTAGSSPGTNVLRRIERFEWDNGFFTPTQRRFGNMDIATPSQYDVANWKKPFPLQLYGYQLSLPGADYTPYLPAASSAGGRGATRRTYTDFNLQALRFGKPIACYTAPPYFLMSRDSPATFGATAGLVGQSFENMPSPRWVRSALAGSDTGVLFSFPSQFVSVAQFQHADLTANDYFLSLAHQPGNAVGNSYAPPFVTRDLSIQPRTDYTLTGVFSRGNSATAAPVSMNYYDMSYLLNTALWDSYFLSTTQSTGASLNPSIQLIDPQDISSELKDPVKASAHFLVNGALNVNATEKDAWKTLLASAKFLKHPKDDGAADTANAMFPRSLEQISASKVPATGSDTDSFSGFRRLTPDQIDALANEITHQVRMRGPFVSLSQFVNRALIGLTPDTSGLGRSGALQSAIDIALDKNGKSINITPSGVSGLSQVNATTDKVIVPVNGSRNQSDLDGGSKGTGNPDDPFVWPDQSRDMNMGSAGSIYADRDSSSQKGDILSSTYSNELGYRSTGIPGWLTQADILQVIGPSITARSDTFKIRCYGEATDPANPKKPLAIAYCEAVVQRMPQYVDSADIPQTPAAKLTSKANMTFGRKYNIISFRWLSPNEI